MRLPALTAGAAVLAGSIAPTAAVAGPGDVVPRVDRVHAGVVAEADAVLTRRPNERLAPPGDDVPRLDRAAAEEDLDQLEWLLEDRYAYLARRGVDHRRGLDSIRAALDEDIRVDDLALQIGMLLLRFGDGHTGVRGFTGRIPGGRLPARLTGAAGAIVARGAGGRPLVAGHPRLEALDGVPIERWVEAAAALAPAGAPHFARRVAVARAAHVAMLRPLAGAPAGGGALVRLGLASPDGASTRELTMRLGPAVPRVPRSMTQHRTLAGGVGYLRLPTFSHDVDPDHASAALEAMHAFRDTTGLVIDVRGNGGGSRFALRALFPFFMAPDEPARVASVAAYKRSEAFDADHLAARFMYRRDDPVWSDRARAAIDAFAPAFAPEWMPPDRAAFSAWHYLVLDRTGEFDAYPYRRPVVILMDGGCFSATDVFLGAFAGRDGVTLLGTPSAGGSGRAKTATLANSGIEVRLSSMVSFRPDGRLYDGRGVEPNRLVPPTIDDVLGRTDTQLDAALALIRGASPP